MAKYIAIVLTLITGSAFSQITQSIKTNQDDVFISGLYDSLIGSNLKIYTGKKFYEPITKKLVEGNQYFHDNDWTTGSIGYQGQVYSNVTIRYHTFLDKLTILNLTGSAIEGPDDKVDFFILHNTKFVRLFEPQEGYYTVLYNGSVLMFAQYYSSRHEKTIQVTSLEDRQKYFIKKNNIITQVKSKGSVMKVLAEEKANLRRFFRKQNIVFSKNRELALKLLGEEFDRLQKLK